MKPNAQTPSPGARPTRVFVLAPHELLRVGFATILRRDPDFQLVGEADSYDLVQDRLMLSRPDIVVIDIEPDRSQAAQLCQQVSTVAERIQFLLLSSSPVVETVFATLANAHGPVRSSATGLQLLTVLRRIATEAKLRGQRIGLDDGSYAEVPQGQDGVRLATLTRRERQILDLLAAGLSNRQIAMRLSVTEKTVKGYVSNVLAKLGVNSRTQAAIMRTQMGVETAS